MPVEIIHWIAGYILLRGTLSMTPLIQENGTDVHNVTNAIKV